MCSKLQSVYQTNERTIEHTNTMPSKKKLKPFQRKDRPLFLEGKDPIQADFPGGKQQRRKVVIPPLPLGALLDDESKPDKAEWQYWKPQLEPVPMKVLLMEVNSRRGKLRASYTGGVYWKTHNPDTPRCRCKKCMDKREIEQAQRLEQIRKDREYYESRIATLSR